MNEDIGKALQALTRPTTPRELEERGVRRLRSIPLSQVSRMIGIALDQALNEHRAELSDEQRAEIVEGAEGRLRDLLSTRRQLDEAADGRREAHAEPQQVGGGSSLDEDAARVAALLDGAEGDPTALRQAVEDAIERARQRESLLERRVAKLLRSAEETETALESALRCFEIPRNLRSNALRGVEQDDPRRDQKLSMMKDVLRSNQGLRGS